MKRKPAPLEITKEWCEKAGAIEEAWGGDVSAGLPIFYPPSITGWTPPEPEKPKANRTRKPKSRTAARVAKPARKGR